MNRLLATAILLQILLLAAFSLPANAQNKRYISDKLEVPLRAGTSTKFKINRMLSSGTPVTLLSHDSETGYTQVRTENGSQGWVLSRYLMDTPSARDSLAQALQAVAPLQSENQQLKQQFAELRQEKTKVEENVQQLESENQRLSQDLSQIRKTSANAITIDERNKELEQQMVDLERKLQIVQQENQALNDNSNQAWFLRGGGVLLLGLILGLIIPRLRLRRSGRWSDL